MSTTSELSEHQAERIREMQNNFAFAKTVHGVFGSTNRVHWQEGIERIKGHLIVYSSRMDAELPLLERTEDGFIINVRDGIVGTVSRSCAYATTLLFVEYQYGKNGGRWEKFHQHYESDQGRRIEVRKQMRLDDIANVLLIPRDSVETVERAHGKNLESMAGHYGIHVASLRGYLNKIDISNGDFSARHYR